MKGCLRMKICLYVFFLAMGLIGCSNIRQEQCYPSKAVITEIENLGGSIEIDKTDPKIMAVKY